MAGPKTKEAKLKSGSKVKTKEEPDGEAVEAKDRSKRSSSDSMRKFPKDIEKYLITIRDFFIVHHGIEISDSECLNVAMHHFLKSKIDIKTFERINISTDSRRQTALSISEKHFNKMTAIAKRMGLPTTQLCLLVAMLVSEVFDENTDYEVSEISDRC